MTRELAHRESDGLEVALLWQHDDDSVALDVYDAKSDLHLAFPVPRDRALDAFAHRVIALATAAGLNPSAAAKRVLQIQKGEER